MAQRSSPVKVFVEGGPEDDKDKIFELTEQLKEELREVKH